MKINTKDVEEIVARFKAGNSHFRVSVLVFNATFSNISVTIHDFRDQYLALNESIPLKHLAFLCLHGIRF
jgi:hypothetical protein